MSFEARQAPEGDSAMTMRTYESSLTAAARIGVSVKTIRRRIAEGVLLCVPVRPHPQVGPRRLRFHVQQVPPVDRIRAQRDETTPDQTRVLF